MDQRRRRLQRGSDDRRQVDRHARGVQAPRRQSPIFAPAKRISETLPAPAEEEVGASAVLTIPPRSARRCFSLRQCVHCSLRRVGNSSCYSDGHEKGRQNAEGIIHCRLPARVVGRDGYARNKPCAVAWLPSRSETYQNEISAVSSSEYRPSCRWGKLRPPPLGPRRIGRRPAARLYTVDLPKYLKSWRSLT